MYIKSTVPFEQVQCMTSNLNMLSQALEKISVKSTRKEKCYLPWAVCFVAWTVHADLKENGYMTW